jgi:hypothetical protein
LQRFSQIYIPFVSICRPDQRGSKELTNNEAEGLCVTDALAPRKHFFNLSALVDDLPTCALPAHQRTRLAGKIALGEDMIRDVRQALTLEVRQIEADTLDRGMVMPSMHVFVVHPNGQWDVRCIPIRISSP